jgi:hypothetical protein
MPTRFASWHGQSRSPTFVAFTDADCNGLVCLVSNRDKTVTVPNLAYGKYPAFTKACIDKFADRRDPRLMKRYSVGEGSEDRINLLLQGASRSLAQKQLGRIESFQLLLTYNLNRGTNKMEVTIAVQRADELYGEGWENNEIAPSMLTPIGPSGELDIESFLEDLSNTLRDCDLRPNS